jgi:hypothetical protein
MILAIIENQAVERDKTGKIPATATYNRYLVRSIRQDLDLLYLMLQKLINYMSILYIGLYLSLLLIFNVSDHIVSINYPFCYHKITDTD